MDDFHYIFWLLNKTKNNDGLHLYMFVKIISSYDVCVQTQTLSNICVNFYFPEVLMLNNILQWMVLIASL